MRPNSLFFDREKNQGLMRTGSMIVTISFLVLLGYILIRYKRFAYLLHGELFKTPMFGVLLLGYVALAVVTVPVIRWANCRVKRMPALWALAIALVARDPVQEDDDQRGVQQQTDQQADQIRHVGPKGPAVQRR